MTVVAAILYVCAVLVSVVRTEFMRGGEASVDTRPSAASLPWRGSLSSGLRESRSVVVFLHGSPGSGDNFASLAPLIEAAGYATLAPDLPGFNNLPNFGDRWSTREHAESVLALLDDLDVQRFHVVGWSMGGGVGLNLADLCLERGQQDRVASLTMLGSVGGPFTESSGHASFEWVKYQLGYFLQGVVPLAIPHMGLLGWYDERVGVVRNFDETDFAQHEAIMTSDRFQQAVPTLLLHGLSDFLTPAWAAEHHRAQMPNSRLVMLDNPAGTSRLAPVGHFIPFIDADRAAGVLVPFLRALDDAAAARGPSPDPIGLAPMQAVLDQAVPDAAEHRPMVLSRFGQIIVDVLMAARRTPWPLVLLVVAYLAWCRPETTTTLAALAVGSLRADFVLMLLAVFIGRAVRRRHWLLEHGWRSACWRWLAPFGFQLLAMMALTPLTIAMHLSGTLYEPAPLLLAVIALPLALNFVKLVPHWRGRRRIAAAVHRAVAFEYWPNWAVYGPILPWLAWQSARLLTRGGGPMTWTACNPGMSGYGGVWDESKTQIIHAIERGVRSDPATAARLDADGVVVLPAVLVDAPNPLRVDRAIDAVRDREELGGYPVIAKPDAGYRGFAVRVCGNDAELTAAMQHIAGPVQLQRYHPGPREVGILWVRTVDPRSREARTDEPQGFIYAVTRKTFPEVVGDGRRTLERLILDHPRYNCQADVFIQRHAARLDLIVPAGVVFRLGRTGNHAQGCLFTDGSDLITPELTLAIDRLVRRFTAASGPRGSSTAPDAERAVDASVRTPGEPGAFDLGRLDIRYASDSELRAGRNFAVVELNGVTSEPTNIYDPGRSPLWSWRVLAGSWTHAFRLGDMRRAMGVRELTIGDVLRLRSSVKKVRRGPGTSD